MQKWYTDSDAWRAVREQTEHTFFVREHCSTIIFETSEDIKDQSVAGMMAAPLDLFAIQLDESKDQRE